MFGERALLVDSSLRKIFSHSRQFAGSTIAASLCPWSKHHSLSRFHFVYRSFRLIVTMVAKEVEQEGQRDSSREQARVYAEHQVAKPKIRPICFVLRCRTVTFYYGVAFNFSH